MLGWKSLFSSTIYENKEIKSGKSIAKWLPLDTLEKAATAIVNEKAGTHFTKSDKVELRLSKASITFFYKNITDIKTPAHPNRLYPSAGREICSPSIFIGGKR